MAPTPPRLPERAAIYIDRDGTVHFGALFEGLVPVARALGAKDLPASAPGPVAPDAAAAEDGPAPDEAVPGPGKAP